MWFKVCNSLSQHRKALEAGPEALGLWVMAGAWSCAQLTDGHVPDYALVRLAPNAEALASRLVQVGLWQRTNDGYQFHEWSDYQPDADDERRKQQQRREAGRKGGLNSGKSRRTAKERTTREAPTEPRAEADASANAQANANPGPDPVGNSSGVPPCSPRSDVSKCPPAKSIPERFEDFWSAYPKRVGKQAAIKAWRKAITLVDPETVIEGARRYAASRQGEDPQFTAHPSTWLNAGRWEDEPQPKHTPPSQMSTRDQRVAQVQELKQQLIASRGDDADGRPLRALPGSAAS